MRCLFGEKKDNLVELVARSFQKRIISKTRFRATLIHPSYDPAGVDLFVLPSIRSVSGSTRCLVKAPEK